MFAAFECKAPVPLATRQVFLSKKVLCIRFCMSNIQVKDVCSGSTGDYSHPLHLIRDWCDIKFNSVKKKYDKYSHLTLIRVNESTYEDEMGVRGPYPNYLSRCPKPRGLVGFQMPLLKNLTSLGHLATCDEGEVFAIVLCAIKLNTVNLKATSRMDCLAISAHRYKSYCLQRTDRELFALKLWLDPQPQ
jgi:hypothetical protein